MDIQLIELGHRGETENALTLKRYFETVAKRTRTRALSISSPPLHKHANMSVCRSIMTECFGAAASVTYLRGLAHFYFARQF